MTEDARFEDGREAPLNLGALDADDLQLKLRQCQNYKLKLIQGRANVNISGALQTLRVA